MTKRKKIIVNATRPTKPLLIGDFSKVLFITKEADKDYKRYTTLDEVKSDFGNDTLMYKGINTFLSQEDDEGNRFQPAQWFCVSKSAPDEAFLNSLPVGDFYGIVVAFYDKAFIKSLANYLIRTGKFAIVLNTAVDKTTNDLKESKRIYYMHGEDGADNLDIFGMPAWTLVRGVNARWADRAIKGVEPSCNDTTKQAKLYENNINYTESVVGYNAVTSGSWCADGERHADQTIKIDAFIHLIESNLRKLLISESNTTMDGEGIPKVEDVLTRSSVEAGKQGIIAKDNSGSYMYKVTVPNIEDTSSRTGLTVDDYINRTLRNTKVDFTISTEIEYIDITLVWHDEPLTA